MVACLVTWGMTVTSAAPETGSPAPQPQQGEAAPVRGGQVAETTTFGATLFGAFGLPEVLPAGQ